MSVQSVREYLKPFGLDEAIREFSVSSATVELAAAAVGVEPARIAKTLSFFFPPEEQGCLLIVAAGDKKIDNKSFKAQFGFRAKMLPHDLALQLTGHAVGGVCPFALPDHVHVYLDRSLCRFSTVFPSAGSASSAVEMTPDQLFLSSHAEGWIDVCKSVSE